MTPYSIDLLLLNAGAILYNTEVLLKKAELLAKIYLKNIEKK